MTDDQNAQTSTLEHWKPYDMHTAACVLAGRQRRWYLFPALLVAVALAWDYKITLTTLNFSVCALYFCAIVHKFFCISLSTLSSPEIRIPDVTLARLAPETLAVIIGSPAFLHLNI